MSSHLPKPSQFSRRLFARRLAIGGAGAFLGAAVWGCFERRRCVVERVPLTLDLGPGAPPYWTLAQLSDFHLDPENDEAWVSSYVAAVNALKPDVIALTGDFVTDSIEALDRLLPYLAKLSAPGGVFACLGNHDQWNGTVANLRRRFDRSPIQLLTNAHGMASLPDGVVRMAGLESCWGGEIRPDLAMSFPSNVRAVLLAHEPDVALQLALDSRWALQLSGHTHGGQCALPPGIPLKLPKFGKRFARGLYATEHAWPIYVNRGIGTLGPRLRVAASPEITLFEITSKPSGAVIS